MMVLDSAAGLLPSGFEASGISLEISNLGVTGATARILSRGLREEIYDAYIRLISFLYRSWMSLRLSLNAAVTRPMSGVQMSLQSVTTVGISKRCSLPREKREKGEKLVSTVQG